MDMKQTLISGLPELKLDLTQAQTDTLCAFGQAVIDQNQVMNLTAITEPQQVAKLHLLDSLTVIVSFFFFNAGTAKLPQSSDGNTITLLVIFLVVIALATLLQQKTVDLTKKMNPEKRGSVYDMKFQERWWESCDEAERRQIGQASYKAYVTVSRFCPYCWGVLLLGNMVFHYGILPSAVVLVIWAVLSVSYTREAIRLGRRGQKTE